MDCVRGKKKSFQLTACCESKFHSAVTKGKKIAGLILTPILPVKNIFHIIDRTNLLLIMYKLLLINTDNLWKFRTLTKES